LERLFFKKNQILKSNEQFKSVFAHKCCVSKGLFRLYAAPSDAGFSRLGISIGKRAGNAVQRNRIKRLIRESFRLEQHNIATNIDFLLIFPGKMSKKSGQDALIASKTMTFEEARSIFLGLAERAAGKISER
jgi:ribonuclease P protein component